MQDHDNRDKTTNNYSNNYTNAPGVTNYISTTARIGKNVKIWHFAYVGDDTVIGNNVMIGSLTHVDYKVKIGDNTRIEVSVYIPPLTLIGKNVFIGPSATFTNDPYPMSRKMVGVIVEDDAIIGSRSGNTAWSKNWNKQHSRNGGSSNKKCPTQCCCHGPPC